MGSSTSTIQELVNNGIHDVDGWFYCSLVQHWYYLFSSLATYFALQSLGKSKHYVERLPPKLLFIALNLGGLALGVWKLNAMGFFPSHTSDWVSSLPHICSGSFNCHLMSISNTKLISFPLLGSGIRSC
ncbi:hypothetical protein Lal_00027151 [Lupinus albus]|nr:hypothetical protein Lal_00027151 [Lupinus albus]